MTSQLPPNLLRLFAPRPPLVYLPPIDKEFRQRRRPVYTGVGGFLGRLDHDQDYQPTKTLGETKRIQKKERAAKHAEQQTRMLQEWDPSVHPSDAFKTLIVANLNYSTTGKQIQREMEKFGRVKSVSLVSDSKTGKSRGYSFVEFENEKDMKLAYKDADGMRIDGFRVLVDVERGRTVKEWKPRRMGGGLGNKRHGRPPPRQRAQEPRSYKNYRDNQPRRREVRPADSEQSGESQARDGDKGTAKPLGTSRPRDSSRPVDGAGPRGSDIASRVGPASQSSDPRRDNMDSADKRKRATSRDRPRDYRDDGRRDRDPRRDSRRSRSPPRSRR